ncbi:MAG: M48 family metallopeptidase [Patescibacteria group bacterium]
MHQEYDIRRSKRKTLALEIDASARLIVRAPMRLALRDIEAFIRQKRTWIRKGLQEMEKVKQVRERERFFEGDTVLYLGKEHTVRFDDVKRCTIVDGIFILPIAVQGQAQKYVHMWYAKQARLYIAPRIRELASVLGYRITGIRITSAKTRWGSCSAKDTISISWRLLQAPSKVIEYVIIHELVHTIHKNHKTRFWQRVAKHCPEYKKHVKWLRDNSHVLGM